MIQNEHQCEVTRRQIWRLEGALEASRATEGKLDPRVYRTMIAGIEGQIEEMRQELREYDALKSARALPLRCADELAAALVKARVARGYTQKELAERLHIKPQQVQKYEATGYQSASLRRVLEVMRVLDLNLQAEIPLR